MISCTAIKYEQQLITTVVLSVTVKDENKDFICVVNCYLQVNIRLEFSIFIICTHPVAVAVL